VKLKLIHPGKDSINYAPPQIKASNQNNVEVANGNNVGHVEKYQQLSHKGSWTSECENLLCM